MDKLAERSTQPLTRCWQTGREDSAEDNETCSRPPTDLRGSSCGMRQPSTGSGAVGLCSRSHRRSGILPVPGMRGKYGTQQIASTRQTGGSLRAISPCYRPASKGAGFHFVQALLSYLCCRPLQGATLLCKRIFVFLYT